MMSLFRSGVTKSYTWLLILIVNCSSHPVIENPCRLNLNVEQDMPQPVGDMLISLTTEANYGRALCQNITNKLARIYLTKDEVQLVKNMNLPFPQYSTRADDPSRRGVEVQGLQQDYSDLSRYIVYFDAGIQTTFKGLEDLQDLNLVLKSFSTLLCKTDLLLRKHKSPVTQFFDPSPLQTAFKNLRDDKQKYKGSFGLVQCASAFLQGMSTHYTRTYKALV